MGLRVMPLATVEDVQAELEDTMRSLLRLGDFPIVDPARREERRQILLAWQDRLAAQLDDMLRERS